MLKVRGVATRACPIARPGDRSESLSFRSVADGGNIQCGEALPFCCGVFEGADAYSSSALEGKEALHANDS